MELFKKKYQPKHLKREPIVPVVTNHPMAPDRPAPREQPLDFKWLDKMIEERTAGGDKK